MFSLLTKFSNAVSIDRESRVENATYFLGAGTGFASFEFLFRDKGFLLGNYATVVRFDLPEKQEGFGTSTA